MSRTILKMSMIASGAAITEVAFAAIDANFAPALTAIVVASFFAKILAILAVARAARAITFDPTLVASFPPILVTFAAPKRTPIFVARRAFTFAMSFTPSLPIPNALNPRFIASSPPLVNPSPARNLRIAGDMARITPPTSPLAISKPISSALSV